MCPNKKKSSRSYITVSLFFLFFHFFVSYSVLYSKKFKGGGRKPYPPPHSHPNLDLPRGVCHYLEKSDIRMLLTKFGCNWPNRSGGKAMVINVSLLFLPLNVVF